jgi:hypothetical protein
MPAGQWLRWLEGRGGVLLAAVEARKLLKLFSAPGGFNKLTKNQARERARRAGVCVDEGDADFVADANSLDCPAHPAWSWELKHSHVEELVLGFYGGALAGAEGVPDFVSAVGRRCEREFLEAYEVRSRSKKALPREWAAAFQGCRMVGAGDDAPRAPLAEDLVKVILGWKLPMLPVSVYGAVRYWCCAGGDAGSGEAEKSGARGVSSSAPAPAATKRAASDGATALHSAQFRSFPLGLEPRSGRLVFENDRHDAFEARLPFPEGLFPSAPGQLQLFYEMSGGEKWGIFSSFKE